MRCQFWKVEKRMRRRYRRIWLKSNHDQLDILSLPLCFHLSASAFSFTPSASVPPFLPRPTCCCAFFLGLVLILPLFSKPKKKGKSSSIAGSSRRNRVHPVPVPDASANFFSVTNGGDMTPVKVVGPEGPWLRLHTL
ncbi:hypothetical protein IE53DRAFT_132860 [Violaceomyces palustris]|uniref:Uncharacterized protein n=1 Tax=Violaceomyces palustris TaxID=1673888 RepID=A0ACD0NV25_9BASI|nr:hypothetical protein IE53DRAFT_132860 [Violaceomyces palustris]